MKSKKSPLKKPKKAPPSGPLIRRTVDNPAYDPAHPEALGNPKTEVVTVDIRESAIETLFARGKLSSLEKKAADHIREIWETYAKAHVSAFDYSADRVSGSGKRGPITDAQIEARNALRRIRLKVGERGLKLLVEICGKGHSLTDVGATNRERTTAADNLRTHLYDVAGPDVLGLWGRKTGKAKIVGARSEKWKPETTDL